MQFQHNSLRPKTTIFRRHVCVCVCVCALAEKSTEFHTYKLKKERKKEVTEEC
jgi:hypothetical protein